MELIDILEEIAEQVQKCKEEISAEVMKRLDDLNDKAQREFSTEYRRCDACGQWVNEDLLEERYDENICEDCLENGYGE